MPTINEMTDFNNLGISYIYISMIINCITQGILNYSSQIGKLFECFPNSSFSLKGEFPFEIKIEKFVENIQNENNYKNENYYKSLIQVLNIIK